ncbi:hypothetical protein Acor_01270 [Acrocarpospora corrugata]|uniref:Uncharacterized protein n=1 Tax=Acrocarpospora corrugata TaxID=35763 RepID=A0A5M3VN41_9ACTN|nr:hypothetical protein [Acrocarpospora corrugata]GER98065.1 hypothetical protein Acor_01270 [Acrocarpospora corrugata]
MRTKITAGLTTGLLAAALTASPAQADGNVTATTLHFGKVASQQTMSYWYANDQYHLREATPYGEGATVAITPNPLGAYPDGPPGIVEPVTLPGAPPGNTGSKSVSLALGHGKAYFVDAGGNPRWCSAFSVSSLYRNMVATAGSCVFGANAAHSNWVFVPAQIALSPDPSLLAPYGVFVGYQAFTHASFAENRSRERDFAFVAVWNGAERIATGARDTGRLADRVGGQGLTYNQPVDEPRFMFGYPAGADPDGNYAYTGRTLKWSYGRGIAERSVTGISQRLLGLKSSFTGQGSFGSGLLHEYERYSRQGYLNGVNAGVSDTDGNGRIDTSVSSYFDRQTFEVYDAAWHVVTGSILGGIPIPQ